MRNQPLDVLRAVAVLLVFCYHSEGALLVSRFGWTGVDLFFVLSGFLVSGLLFREYQATGQIRPGRFLLRRGFKIYPQFYFLIVLTLVYIAIWSRLEWPSVFAEIFFYQSYTRGIWTHTWSLAIEEHFYLLLAAAIALLARRGGENPFQPLPRWLLASGAAILCLRAATWIAHPAVSEYRQVFPSHLRIDSFFGGVLAAYYQTFHPDRLGAWCRRWGAWLPPASVLLLAPVSFLLREDAFMVTLGYSMVSWAFVLLLLSVLHPRKASVPGRGTRALAALGRVSYAFYLWHAPVLLASDWMRPHWAQHGIEVPLAVNLAATFAVSLGLAVLTTRLLEAPMLRLRDRLLPSTVKPPLPSTAPVLAEAVRA